MPPINNGRHKSTKRALHMRLYWMLISLTAFIIFIIALVLLLSLSSMLYETTKSKLQETARSISTTYGSAVFENSIRVALHSGEFSVRVITEEGTILIDPSDLSVYDDWPTVNYDISQIVSSLDESDGNFVINLKDENEHTWVLYGQLIAMHDNVREILLVTTAATKEQSQLRDLTTRLLEIVGVILIFAFFLCRFLVKIFFRPIDDITKQAKLLSTGDYSVVFPESGYTELDTLSDLMNQSVEHFAEYEEMRREMVANLSHDLRTPLTMIKAYAEMIQNISGDNPAKRNAHLDVIISQSDKLSEFVNATLDLAKLQAGRQELRFSDFDLSLLAGEYVKSIEEVSDKDKYSFYYHCDDDCYINADKDRIEQLMSNLISNAMKYGGGTIEVSVSKSSNRVLLEIKDNGGKIPTDKVHMIWNKYYRINPFDKDAASSGVGLSIVKEIADLHKSEYGVDIEENQYTRFWFYFTANNR